MTKRKKFMEMQTPEPAPEPEPEPIPEPEPEPEPVESFGVSSEFGSPPMTPTLEDRVTAVEQSLAKLIELIEAQSHNIARDHGNSPDNQ